MLSLHIYRQSKFFTKKGKWFLRKGKCKRRRKERFERGRKEGKKGRYRVNASNMNFGKNRTLFGEPRISIRSLQISICTRVLVSLVGKLKSPLGKVKSLEKNPIPFDTTISQWIESPTSSEPAPSSYLPVHSILYIIEKWTNSDIPSIFFWAFVTTVVHSLNTRKTWLTKIWIYKTSWWK